MLDPLTSTTFAIHNGKGVYALLLGSGISRAANIPTGWEVTLDLIGRIAAMKSESVACHAGPEAWFRAQFGCEPSYSDLLEHLAISPAERTAALARYFELGEGMTMRKAQSQQPLMLLSQRWSSADIFE